MAPSNSAKRMTGLDNAFLTIEIPNNLMTCSGIFTFAEDIEESLVEEVFVRMCQEFPRYKSRFHYEGPFRTCSWEVIEDFDVKGHIKSHTLPAPGTKEQLMDLAAKVVAVPLDYEKPLWYAHIVYGLDGKEGKSALILLGHHSMADGQGFVRSLLSITSAREQIDAAIKGSQQVEKRSKPRASELPPFNHPFLRPFTERIPQRIADFYAFFLMMFFTFVSTIIGLFLAARTMIRYLISNRKTFAYKGPQNINKEYAWSDEVSMEDIKLIRQAYKSYNITLNDVMCTVMTRAIRSYLVDTKNLKDSYLSLFIPVSLRQKSDWDFKNLSGGSFAFFTFDQLPTKQLVKHIHDEMADLKRSLTARLGFAIANSLYSLPSLLPRRDNPVFGGIVNHMMSKSHGVLTNVPGPSKPIFLGKHQIIRYVAMPPQCGKGNLAMGLLSYNGKMCASVMADVDSEYPNVAKEITRRFVDEFNVLVLEAKAEIKLRALNEEIKVENKKTQ